MTDTLHARVLAALRGVAHPAKGDVLTAGLVRDLAVTDAGEVSFTFLLGRDDPATLVRQVRKAVEGVAGVEPPARKQVMLQLMPVALKYLPITATGTIAFGVTMYLYLGQLNPAVLFGSVKFLLIFAALLIVLAMFTFGILVVMRTALKIKTHLEEPKCEHMPLVGAMQKLFARGQVVVFAIGMAVVGLMVVASHL